MIPNDIFESAKHAILGTCRSCDSIIEEFDLEKFDIDAETLEELLEIDSVQCCPECGWWAESYEFEEDGEDVPCESCRS